MQESAPTRKAEAPFDDPHADFVLQTSDNFTFHILSHIMSVASPVFRHMFVLPHPPAAEASSADYVDGKPVVHVTEDSKTMDVFLRCCYPILRPSLDISHLAAIHRAADKYDAEAVEQHVVSELSRYIQQTEHSLRAYILACHFGLRDEAKRAARQTLEMRKEDLILASFPELELVPASSFTLLLSYRLSCHRELAELFTPRWHITHPKDGLHGEEVGRPPLWRRLGEELKPSCSCDVLVGHIDYGFPSTNYVHFLDRDEDDIDDDIFYTHYWVKKWCWDYMTNVHKLSFTIMGVF
ncbi:hypothetical protein NM688_g5781 [Phlebia brevispora]|uniref:Uncharacterized protein n=1 Tax=Phlebia brevispora TaxID=194682 RepID=A0ACC1SQ82_9APHY|nr:hypothetical protein NM688_g5781 [Phlebia brevispora]